MRVRKVLPLGVALLVVATGIAAFALREPARPVVACAPALLAIWTEPGLHDALPAYVAPLPPGLPLDAPDLARQWGPHALVEVSRTSAGTAWFTVRATEDGARAMLLVPEGSARDERLALFLQALDGLAQAASTDVERAFVDLREEGVLDAPSGRYAWLAGPVGVPLDLTRFHASLPEPTREGAQPGLRALEWSDGLAFSFRLPLRAHEVALPSAVARVEVDAEDLAALRARPPQARLGTDVEAAPSMARAVLRHAGVADPRLDAWEQVGNAPACA